MFKKIHSNRNPEDTVYSELKKEFTVYFVKAGTIGRHIIGRYPKFIFGAMIFLMLVSIALTLSVFRKPQPVAVKQPPKTTLKPLNDGFSEILRVGSALKETISLKKQVDSISAKKTLNKTDSVTLVADLDRLQQINQPFNKKKK
jgi:hypothetical protein